MLKNKNNLESMARLVDELAHDYNNMMAIIIGYSDLLNNQFDDEKVKQLVGPITSASERAVQLSDNLLAFSRQNFKHTKEVDLNDYLDLIAQDLKQIASEKLNIDIQVDKGLWNIKVDPADFKTAIFNMVRNASDAASDHGVCSVKARNATLNQKEAELLEIQSGNFVVLEVADNGRGMSKDIQERVFDPMFSAKKDKGAGMGLSQVYGFVQRAKGTIECESKVGEGSLFRLYIPVSIDQVTS